MKNDNCDGSGPCRPGEVRVLPLGTNPHHGNLILCFNCFLREINFRSDRNKELSKDCQFALPTWESLKVYGQDEPIRRVIRSRKLTAQEANKYKTVRDQVSAEFPPAKPTHYQHRRGRRLGAV